MSAAAETELLIATARDLGFTVPDVTTIGEFEAAILVALEPIRGGQDHGHARNGLTSALEAARTGNAEFVRAGLWEAKKVLKLVHEDRNPARIE